MKTDQDLIFEAYSKTLNEGSHLEGDESREKNIQRGKEAISTEQELFYNEYGADAFEDQYGFRYPEEDYENSDSGILEQLEIFMSNNPATEKELAPILNELLEVAEEFVKFDEFIDDEFQDEYLFLLNKLSTTAKT